MSDYARFQYSRFDNKNGQYVVRGDDRDEFELDVDYMNSKIDVGGVPTRVGATQDRNSVPVTADDFNDKHICPVHSVPMETKVSKKTNKPYKFHDVAEGRCFGKGAMPPKF